MYIKGRNIAEVWENSIIALLQNGSWTSTERGLDALELIGVTLNIEDPILEPRVHHLHPFPKTFLTQYEDSLICKLADHDSIYNRLHCFSDSQINQVSILIKHLKKQIFSRRCVLTTWNPQKDISSNHPPCLLTLQFLVRNKMLHMISVFRSNDAWLGALCDILALTKFQENIAKQIGISIGRYTHVASSYHLYELDVIKAREVFKEIVRD